MKPIIDGHLRCQIRKQPNWTSQHLLEGPQISITDLNWAKADTILVSVSCLDGTVCSWDTNSRTLLHVIAVPHVDTVRGSPHHALVVASGLDRSLWICHADYGTGVQISVSAKGITFLPDGKSIISARDSEDGLNIWDVQPLLDYQEEWPTGRVTLASGSELPELTPTTLVGPQVGSLRHFYRDAG